MELRPPEEAETTSEPRTRRRLPWALLGMVVLIVALFGAGTALIDSDGSDADTGVAVPDDDQDLEAPPRDPLACTRDGQPIGRCLEVLREDVRIEEFQALGDLLLVRDDAGDHEFIDPTTGAVRWHLHQSDVGSVEYAVPFGDIVLVRTADDFRALDPADGSVRWTLGGDHELVHAVGAAATGRPTLLVVARDDRFLAVTSDGRTLWETDLVAAGPTPETVGLIGATDRTLLVRHWPESPDEPEEVFVLDREDGSVLWTLDPTQGDVLSTDRHVVRVTTEDVIPEELEPFSAEVTLTGYDDLTGTQVWEHGETWPRLQEGPVAIPIGGVVALLGPEALTVLDAADGALAWSGDPIHRLVFPMFRWVPLRLDRDDLPLVVEREGRLERLDPTDGTVLWSREATLDGHGTVAGDHLLWTTATGVHVVDVDTGDELVVLPSEVSIVSVDPLVAWDTQGLLRLTLPR